MKRFLFIMLGMLLLHSTIFSQAWKTYPYHKENTLLYFPQDEGRHPEQPDEWWYFTAHLTGNNSGLEYTVMIVWFYSPSLGFDGFRIFNLSEIDNNEFYSETLPCSYPVLAQDSLNLQALTLSGNTESFVNLTDSNGKALPFQYHINAFQNHGDIHLDLDATKPPLIVADSGFLNEGASSYSWYYSQTGINVSGTIALGDVAEPVSGTGWIDRQYGTFDPGTGENYEWFSIQLSNGMDMNVWNIFTLDNRIPDTSTYRICSIYYNENQQETRSAFNLKRLKYTYMPDSLMCYSQQWRLRFDSVDLIIHTLNPNREVGLPFRFYEGSTQITGSVGNTSVTGVGFAELLHSYKKPQVAFLKPDTTVWDQNSEPVVWQNLAPDDGNPIYYSLTYSIDGGTQYETLASNISDTVFLWDHSFLPDSTYCIFRIDARSIDSTLSTNILSDSVMLLLKTGIDEHNEEANLKIYPLPTNGLLNVAFKQMEELTLFDPNGKQVYHYAPPNTFNFLSINLESLSSGAYFLQIKTYRNLLTKTILIVH